MLYLNGSANLIQSIGQFNDIEVQSDYIQNIIWEIIDYPISEDSYVPNFVSSSSLISTETTDTFVPKQYGTYIIKATVENVGEFIFYLMVSSLATNKIIPFYTESKQINKTEGQFKNLYDALRIAHKLSYSGCTIRIAVMDDTILVGSLAEIVSVFDSDMDDVIYNAQPFAGVGAPAIVVEKITVANSGIPLNKTVYKLVETGTIRLNNDIALPVDANKKFYYNFTTFAITNSPSDLYMGRYFATEKLLIIDPIIMKAGISVDASIHGSGTIASPFSVSLLATEQLDDYTLALTDNFKMIDVNKGSAVTVTVPKFSVVEFPVGSMITIRQTGNGQVTIAPVDGDVILEYPEGLKIGKQYGMAMLVNIAENVWAVTGLLEA
jgi:hypothetical protein